MTVEHRRYSVVIVAPVCQGRPSMLLCCCRCRLARRRVYRRPPERKPRHCGGRDGSAGARAWPQNWWGKITQARGAGSFCAMCSHGTSCPWCTQKQTQRTMRHQSTSSLLSINERVAPGSPVARIGLNRRVLT